MLIQFSCKTNPNITMFENDAKHMLKLMNQSGQIPSALNPEDIVAALNALQQGLKAETDNNDAEISMSTRAYPLSELLKHAIAKEEPVMWDYDTNVI